MEQLDLEQIKAARRERTAARRARKAQRIATYRTLQRMHDQGYSPDDIAKAVGITRERMKVVRRQIGITMPSYYGCRKIATYVREQEVVTLRSLADRAGMSVEMLLRRLLIISLSEGGKIASRVLGKEGLPKKTRASGSR